MMRLKLSLLLICVMLSMDGCFLSQTDSESQSNETPSHSESSANTKGNLSGNIHHGGIFTEYIDVIYFIGFDGIYRIDNGKAKKIKDTNNDLYYEAECLNADGDFIYYCNRKSEEKGIFKYDMKGSEVSPILLKKVECYNLMLYDKYLYFIASSGINKMSLQGQSIQVIVPGDIHTFDVSEDTIFFVDDDGIFYAKSDGTLKTKISDHVPLEILTDQNYVYYGINGALRKMRHDGTNLTTVTEKECLYLHLAGNFLYFTVLNEKEGNLFTNYRVNTDGAQLTAFEGIYEFFSTCVFANQIFYEKYIKEEEQYAIIKASSDNKDFEAIIKGEGGRLGPG